MKLRLTLFALLTVFTNLPSTFAEDDISVVINGKSYSCGEDGGGACQEKANIGKSSFEACKKTSRTYLSCFDSIFGTRHTECAKWSEACNDACYYTPYTKNDCYEKCY